MKRFSLILAVCLLGVQGCSEEPAPRYRVGDYELQLETSPSPLAVGKTAEMTVLLSKNNQAVPDCLMHLRQTMPGMEMSTDRNWYELKAIAPAGQYQGQSGEFSMGGDWELEIAFTCNGAGQTVKIPAHLDWPE